MITDPDARGQPSADGRRRHRGGTRQPGARQQDSGQQDSGQQDSGRHAAGRPSGRGRLVTLPVVLALVGLAVAACLGPRVLATGETASSFSLPALTSSHTRISLSDYAGQPVIINFFASWSPPCTAETGLLAHFYRYYHGKVRIVGVDSRDDRSAGLSLLRRSRVTYPVASDPALVVAAKYGVPGIPATYFLNAQHEIVKTDLGWLSWKKLRVGVAAMDAG